MKRTRVIYANDARHFYLFVFDPPMTMEDAWRPVDDAAGTSVDTFVYMVERGDGVFYPSKVAGRFGSDIQPFDSSAYYHVWYNMQSLIDQGLDPLTVLIDRAHDKGMDFIASLRMTAYLGMDRSTAPPEGRGVRPPGDTRCKIRRPPGAGARLPHGRHRNGPLLPSRRRAGGAPGG